MNVIGISALYHDAACCLLQDGELIAAVQEERFTKKKSDSSMPFNAFKYCLSAGGISILDVDAVAYYEDPVKKLSRQLWSGYDYFDPEVREKLNPARPEQEIRHLLGFQGDIKFYDHHLSHAASSYFFSEFDRSAILIADGVGEWATTSYGYADQNRINLFEKVDFPDSIGLLYAAVTSFLGFKVNGGEYKVMGLAPYGRPVFVESLRRTIELSQDGQYALDMKYFDFVRGTGMYTPELTALLGIEPRTPEAEIQQHDLDLAKSIQVLIEEILILKARYLHERTQVENLSMAGGVALNCVANGKLIKNTPFERLYIQPAANDAGCALGAAALAFLDYGGERKAIRPMQHVYFGPEYSGTEIKSLLGGTSLDYTDYSKDRGGLLAETARQLSEGKVLGWFQGRMEFGQRSLGARSIIADPRNPDMRDRINKMVKKREAFRPFAPSVLEDQASAHFAIDHPSPFMLETCAVISDLNLPAITHVDNSARIQTVGRHTSPIYYDLIAAFYQLTGCPILLNTSFNVRGQPIVNTPLDALICFINSGIDCLVLGDYLIEKESNDMAFFEFVYSKYINFHESDIAKDVYTFL